jgi:hypothetical protein
MFDREKQLQQNQAALDSPKPGDYWHEMFCPYFLVVRVQGPKITVLSAVGGPDSFNRKDEICARIKVDSDHWTWDLDRHMVVDRAWMEKLVRYDSIDGFCADVVQGEKHRAFADSWRIHQVDRLRKEYEELAGWSALTTPETT